MLQRDRGSNDRGGGEAGRGGGLTEQSKVRGLLTKIERMVRAMRPEAREMTQHGGPPGWLEESDPVG